MPKGKSKKHTKKCGKGASSVIGVPGGGMGLKGCSRPKKRGRGESGDHTWEYIPKKPSLYDTLPSNLRKSGKGAFNDWMEDIPVIGHALKKGTDAIYNTVHPGENKYFGDNSLIGKIGARVMPMIGKQLINRIT